MPDLLHGKTLTEWCELLPDLELVIAEKPMLWVNPHYGEIKPRSSVPDLGLVDIEAVVPDLTGVYIRQVPTVDGWNQRYLVWVDDEGYLLLSSGADGRLDSEYRTRSPNDTPGMGRLTDADADILFSNGTFIQWPAARDHD